MSGELWLILSFWLSAMDGVPFVISEKFTCASSDVSVFNQSCASYELLNTKSEPYY